MWEGKKIILNKNMHPKLVEFTEFLGELIQNNKDEQIITKKVADRLKELMIEDEVIPDIYKQPNPEKYTLYPVYVDPENRFCIASAVWDVGQSTPIHDHGTWGVIGILQGIEHEIHYDVSTGPPKKIRETNLNKGEVTVCCTSDQDVHEVACATNVPCVGLHVYGGNIGKIKRHAYDFKTGEKKDVVTSWDPLPQ